MGARYVPVSRALAPSLTVNRARTVAAIADHVIVCARCAPRTPLFSHFVLVRSPKAARCMHRLHNNILALLLWTFRSLSRELDPENLIGLRHWPPAWFLCGQKGKIAF